MLLFSPEFNPEGKYKKIIFWENPDENLKQILIENFEEHNRNIEEEWSKSFGPELVQQQIEIQFFQEQENPEKQIEEK